jgi:hypothetical protein
MKRIAVLLTLACSALLVASFAFADDGGKKEKGEKAAKKCHNVSLKGTAEATTFTIIADKSNKAGRDLKGQPVTLTFSGKVNVNAQMCSGDSATAGAAAASTFKLRNMKVAKPQAAEEDDD